MSCVKLLCQFLFARAHLELFLHGKNVFGHVVLYCASWLLDWLKMSEFGYIFVCCPQFCNNFNPQRHKQLYIQYINEIKKINTPTQFFF